MEVWEMWLLVGGCGAKFVTMVAHKQISSITFVCLKKNYKLQKKTKFSIFGIDSTKVLKYTFYWDPIVFIWSDPLSQLQKLHFANSKLSASSKELELEELATAVFWHANKCEFSPLIMGCCDEL